VKKFALVLVGAGALALAALVPGAASAGHGGHGGWHGGGGHWHGGGWGRGYGWG